MQSKFTTQQKFDMVMDCSSSGLSDYMWCLYIKLKKGYDPQQDKEHQQLMRRLADGTDETSIDYL